MDSQLLRSTNLANQYKIDAAPTFIINGRYKVDPSMVNGDGDRLFEVVDYLVQKSQKGER
jgi:protein-disulfide isomerase